MFAFQTNPGEFSETYCVAEKSIHIPLGEVLNEPFCRIRTLEGNVFPTDPDCLIHFWTQEVRFFSSSSVIVMVLLSAVLRSSFISSRVDRWNWAAAAETMPMISNNILIHVPCRASSQ